MSKTCTRREKKQTQNKTQRRRSKNKQTQNINTDYILEFHTKMYKFLKGQRVREKTVREGLKVYCYYSTYI